MTDHRPAILGGAPICTTPLNIVRPLLPPLSSIRDRLAQVLVSGQMTNHGRYVREFEQALAEYLDVKHVVAVANATLGLMILAKALGREGEIILPSFTFSATAHAAVWAGLRPVFADILPDTYTLDPDAVARLVSGETVGIMGVHIYGHPCEVTELEKLANGRRLPLVFDAAHAFGSRYKGLRVGAAGFAQVFSFHATKIFPVGEGGAVVTDDDVLAQELRLLRNFGDPGTENTQLPGLNAKMQEFNALIGLENLQAVEQHIVHRLEIAGLVRSTLSDIPGLTFQAQRSYARSNGQNLSLLVDETQFGLDRDQLYEALRAENIRSRKYFYPPLHRHDAYGPKTVRDRLPITERISGRILCLPIYSDMSRDEAQQLCAAIRRIHTHRHAILRHLAS